MRGEHAWGRGVGAWLVVAACAVEPPGASSGASTAGSPPSVSDSTAGPRTTTPDSTRGETSSSATGGAGVEGANDDSSGSSAGPMDSTGSGSTGHGSGSGAASTSSGGDPRPPCVAGCEVELACSDAWRSEQACVDACEANLVEATAFEVACAAAWEDLHACLGTLTCEQFVEWMDPTGFPYPCLSEDEVLGFECAGQLLRPAEGLDRPR